MIFLLAALAQDVVDDANGITIRPPGPGWSTTRLMVEAGALAAWARPIDGAVMDVRVVRPEKGESFARETDGLLAVIARQANEKPRGVVEGRGVDHYWLLYTITGVGGEFRTKIVWKDAGDRWFAFRCSADAPKFTKELERDFDRWVAAAAIRPAVRRAPGGVDTAGWFLGGAGVVAAILTMLIVRRRRSTTLLQNPQVPRTPSRPLR